MHGCQLRTRRVAGWASAGERVLGPPEAGRLQRLRLVGSPAVAGLVLWGILWGLTPDLSMGADAENLPLRSNQVPGIKAFTMDFDSGSMALHALGAALAASGHPSTYHRLVALCGAGFKFVYDTTEAYEPLRDVFPVDVLRDASSVTGFPDAHWEAGRSLADVKAIVKREIDQGRPLLAPFLKNDAYHGFFLIVGYDFDAGVFYLQGALRDSAYASVPIPKRWDGPTASPVGWADNPVFTLGAYDEGHGSDGALGLDKAMITTGMTLLRGGTLTYGSHPGELPYMQAPGPHLATYGIPAYRLLSLDVGGGDLIVRKGSEDEANFGLIWRLDAQLGQLETDRANAATALSYLVPRVSGGKSVEVEELVANVHRTVTDVVALRKIFWDEIPHQINSPETIVSYVKNSNSMVFSFAGNDRYFQDLGDRGLRAFKTRWGPVIIADSPEKRLQARVLVRSLEARERASLGMMEGIEDFIAPDLGVPPPEPRKGGPRQRR